MLLSHTAAEQIIGREGETATLLSRCPLNLGGLSGGFAPRQFGRSAFRAEKTVSPLISWQYERFVSKYSIYYWFLGRDYNISYIEHYTFYN